MRFAEGMQEATRVAEGFASDTEAAAYWSVGGTDVAFEELTLPNAAGQSLPGRIYRGAADAPVLIYIHGGGWAGGSIALNHASASRLAAQSGWNVLAISYRLAPQHPYPAALSDCAAAYEWLMAEGPALRLSTQTLAVGGASAGANLALALALSLPKPAFDAMLLFYGVFSANLSSDSYTAYRDGPGLTRARMAELFAMYDPDGRRESDPLVAPVLSEALSHLPSACLIAAEHDVLLDDSRVMAKLLRAAGVPTDLHVEPGVTHGFINRGRLVPAANACIARAAQFLTTLS